MRNVSQMFVVRKCIILNTKTLAPSRLSVVPNIADAPSKF